MASSRMVLLVAIVGFALACGSVEGLENVTAATEGNCSTVATSNPHDCCRSFLELHYAILECLPRPDAARGSQCIAHCILQGYAMRPVVGSMPIAMSRIIVLAPKVATHFDKCKGDLSDYLLSATFEGDFHRVICDERLNRFLECMVKSWFLDCMGADDTNATCNELRDNMESSTCPLVSFFGKHRSS